jgi:biopolymer transport protein ExbB
LNGFEYNLLTLFADGGPMMYALLLFSLVALGVTIAKAWTLWVAHRDTQRVLDEVRELTEAGRIREAIRVTSQTPGPAAAILLAGLRRIEKGRVREDELEQAINTAGTIELGFLERGLVILATVANVAPLMGFLGTVAGMIMAFASIEAMGDVDPSAVAAGIKVALLTTATGLLIAIPVNVAYNFFVTRIDKLIMDMEQGTQQLLNLAWDMERRGQLEVVTATSPVAATEGGLRGPVEDVSPQASPPTPDVTGGSSDERSDLKPKEPGE